MSEWNYPLDYATAIDQAIQYIKAIEVFETSIKEIENEKS